MRASSPRLRTCKRLVCREQQAPAARLYAASDRGDWGLRRIRAPFPDGHKPKALLAGTINRPLPRSAVDDLGDVPANRTVYWLLSKHFEPEQKR